MLPFIIIVKCPLVSDPRAHISYCLITGKNMGCNTNLLEAFLVDPNH